MVDILAISVARSSTGDFPASETFGQAIQPPNRRTTPHDPARRPPPGPDSSGHVAAFAARHLAVDRAGAGRTVRRATPGTGLRADYLWCRRRGGELPTGLGGG